MPQGKRPSDAPADRLVRLNGTFNFREVGGYPASGGTTRWGRLYRSDALFNLDANDRDELRRREIGLVVDLRDETERAFLPSRLEDLETVVHHVPILTRPTSEFIAEDVSLAEFYDHIVDRSGPRIVAALEVIARSDGTPILVHCTAGKDRTGLVIAFALLLVGVDREAVIADYAQTATNLPRSLMDQILERLRAEHAHDAVHLEELVRESPAPVLERTLDRIVAHHGSLERYLSAHGLSAEDAAALRRLLVADD